jgi:hypothetical protein
LPCNKAFQKLIGWPWRGKKSEIKENPRSLHTDSHNSF